MTAAEILKNAADTQDTGILIEASLILDAKADLDESERLTLAAILDVIESRIPGATNALDAWIEDDEDTRSYAQVLRDVAALS